MARSHESFTASSVLFRAVVNLRTAAMDRRAASIDARHHRQRGDVPYQDNAASTGFATLILKLASVEAHREALESRGNLRARICFDPVKESSKLTAVHHWRLTVCPHPDGTDELITAFSYTRQGEPGLSIWR
jgi:hypothetical protein